MDSGNFSDNPSPEGVVKTRALIEGMERMGYSVVNVGERDIREGYDTFVSRTEGSKLRFISANVVDKATQKPIFPPYTVVEASSADGSHRKRVGLVGVLRFNPVFRQTGPEGRQMVIVHPTEHVRQAVEALKGEQVDLVVLLAALHRDDALHIVQDVPGIDFVIGSYGGVLATEQETSQGTWILYAGNQGKRLGSTRVFLAENGSVRDQATKIHNLTQVYPQDQEMQAFVDAIPRNVSAPQPAPVSRAPNDAGPYLGAVQCRTCHDDAYAQWEGTPHASAMESLSAKGRQQDAACVRCHATGVGQAGGFLAPDKTPQLAGVSCEACHGPGRAHVAAPRAPYGKVELARCTGCHDFDNSPDFDYYTYLPRVRHAVAAVTAGSGK